MKIFYKKSSIFITALLYTIKSLLTRIKNFYYYNCYEGRLNMKRFHRNFNIMSMFTAFLLAVTIFFWQTFMNIAVSNIVLNGIIIGTTIFGICVCFAKMFKLLPEYRWLHSYFDGKSIQGWTPTILRPVAMALHNRHTQITTTNLTELLELVSSRMEDERDSIRYITNTLIFLGLLGTFWGLIITVGGFAQMLMGLNFESEMVLTTMQNNMTVPLAGMATAFTSSLLGLAGSLTVGFLGLQLQFAQNTVFQDLTDFMTQYVLQKPGKNQTTLELVENAPVNEAVYSKITDIYDGFNNAGYDIRDLIRIDGKYPGVIAIGSNEKLFIGVAGVSAEVLDNMLKRIELCFADTLDGVKINTRILCLDGTRSDLSGKIIHFATSDALKRYLLARTNVPPRTAADVESFNAYTEYIDTVIRYIFK